MDIAYTLSNLQQAGLTQQQVAAELGCSQPTVSEMQAGKIGKSRPSFKIVFGLMRLAEKHGIPTDKPPAS